MLTRLSDREFWRFVVLPFVVCAIVYGSLSSGLPAIGGSSEAREAHVIRLMAEQSDYVLPSRNGLIPSKPPLYHWIGVTLSKAGLGFTPFAARLPSVIAGAIMLLVTLFLARILSAHLDSGQQGYFVVFAGFVLSSSYGFERMRTVAMVDTVFAGMVTLAVASVARRLWDKERSHLPLGKVLTERDRLFFFVCMALAVLAKGPIGVVLSALLVAPLVLSRLDMRQTALFFLRPSLGWILFLFLVVPWYYFAATRSGGVFVGKQIIFENLQRFTGGENVNAQPWWFYLPSFIRGALPWSLMFLATAYATVRYLSRAKKVVSALQSAVNGLLGSVIICCLFFSFSRGKRDSYLLPLFPWVAIVVTHAMYGFYWSLIPESRVKIGRFCDRAVVVLVAVLILASVTLEALAKFGLHFQNQMLETIVQWLIADRFLIDLMVAASVGLIISAQTVTVNVYYKLTAWSLSFLVCMSLLIAEGYSIRNRFKDFEAVARGIKLVVLNEPLQVVREPRDEFFDGILYYLGRSVNLVDPRDFSTKCSGFALVRDDHWQEMKGHGVLLSAKEVEVYSEIDDRLRGKTSNQKVLVKCPL